MATNNRREDGRSKTKLSKNVLQMKFMKRTQDNGQDELEEEEKRRVHESHWELDRPDISAKESRFEVEQSYAACADLMFGRMSYKGMNSEIEKIMKNNAAKEDEEKSEQRERDGTVSDEEMARRYNNLIGPITNKLPAKRHQSFPVEEQAEGPVKKAKREFLKPPNE